MNTKETIAKALYEYAYARVHWKWGGEDDMVIPIREMYLNEAEAVINALAAEAPKELMDCLLSDEKMAKIEELGTTDIDDVAKAQLQSSKLKAYIDSQVQEAVQAERALIMERYYAGFMNLHMEVDRPRGGE